MSRVFFNEFHYFLPQDKDSKIAFLQKAIDFTGDT